jgi:hypothetical protein
MNSFKMNLKLTMNELKVHGIYKFELENHDIVFFHDGEWTKCHE